ncbi:cytidylyltransferase domain-containing protein [Pseudoruegeria sp. HB172150]|uniref:cytidylyltransferase domain-containing protein n=1 Tax=Pseudoruegeria sp. HB172150 TaxID=2721164 RepID=UPI00352FD295
MTGRTAAIILARGGSKGIPGKNLCRVGGLTLVARSVRAARGAGQVDAGVWVSTDDPAIAEEAHRHGAGIIHRPAALAGDTASSETGWLHALGHVRAAHPGVARLVLLQCTSPFTTAADIAACLAAQEAQGADCALSVIPDHGFLWRRDAGGFGRGCNHDEAGPRARRQDLAPVFRESGAIYTVDAAAFERTGRRFCGRVALCERDHPPFEIDGAGDLALAGALARLRDGGGVDRARLATIRAVAMDFDGVHTDDTVLTDQEGRESVRCSRRDGLGLEMLRKGSKLAMVILSKEVNPVVRARARKLRIEAYGAVEDKAAALAGWCAGQGIDPARVLYVGNDLNDRPAMQRAGLSACPSDAHPEILAIADWVLPHPGGRGALRAMAERLMEVHGTVPARIVPA